MLSVLFRLLPIEGKYKYSQLIPVLENVPKGFNIIPKYFELHICGDLMRDSFPQESFYFNFISRTYKKSLLIGISLGQLLLAKKDETGGVCTAFFVASNSVYTNTSGRYL